MFKPLLRILLKMFGNYPVSLPRARLPLWRKLCVRFTAINRLGVLFKISAVVWQLFLQHGCVGKDISPCACWKLSASPV